MSTNKNDNKPKTLSADDIYNPFSKFHPSNKIHHTAVIHDNVTLGKNNVIGAYTVIGSNGEIRGATEFKGKVIIGSGNVISELVTIQCPQEETFTEIGDNNLIMAHSHIGHDVKIGSECEICTGSIIGGYAVIEDQVKIKLGCTIRNRKIIGQGSLVGMGSVVVKDVEPGSVVYGNPAK